MIQNLIMWFLINPYIYTTWEAEQYLVSCDGDSDKIYIHDWITSTITDSFSSPDASPTWLCVSDWNLISCDNTWSPDTIYIHSWITSTISSSFASPSTSPKDLTVVNS